MLAVREMEWGRVMSPRRVTLGQYIKNRRRVLGMTQVEMAELLDRDQTYVSHLELGKRKSLPEPHEVNEIARVLRVSVFDLLKAIGFHDEEEIHEEPAAVQVFTQLAAEVESAPEINESLRGLMLEQIGLFRRQWEREQEIAHHGTDASRKRRAIGQ